MKHFNNIPIVTILLFSYILTLYSIKTHASALTSEHEIYKGFINPPQEAKPRVWWHWMDGNITEEGIYKDLLWMNRIGIGGFHQFDASLYTKPIVKERLVYMTPKWKKAFRYAIHLADSLNMEVGIASAPGWSSTGGPWVNPKNAMKKLVWRTFTVEGQKMFSGKLPSPYTTTGEFQNIPIRNMNNYTEYYEDIATIAVRLPSEELSLNELDAEITSSGGNFSLHKLTDGDFTNAELLPFNPFDKYGWIEYSFPKPQTIRALSFVSGRLRTEWRSESPQTVNFLQCSDNGVDYRMVCGIPDGGNAQQTISIPETTARYFRVLVPNPTNNAPGTQIPEFVLHPTVKINHTEEKAGFSSPHDLMNYPTPETNTPIDKKNVIILTNKLDSNGILKWNVPEGKWRIYRFGYSLTGKRNHPAPAEATGLEVDKLDPESWLSYFRTYMDMYKEAAGGFMGKRGIQYIITDSYEAHWQTWTPSLPSFFKHKYGYDLLPWLPVLTGEIIENTSESECFLRDWRLAIAELYRKNYDRINSIVKEYGLKGRYTEAHENGRVYVGDGMEIKRTATFPMAALWMPNSGACSSQQMGQADIRESASVAHIYGQNIVAAEFGSAIAHHAYACCPENIKPIADKALANGLNRFVIHETSHQPVDDKIPGLGLIQYGQWFNRHETWAEQAKVWIDYLARSSYMLQQGNNVADILYYYGEDNCITGLYAHTLPDIPAGYEYDFIDPYGFVHDIKMDKKCLLAPSGRKYSILILGENTKVMSLKVLKKIASLVEEGVAVLGREPIFRGSNLDNADEFKALVTSIWHTNRKNVYTDTPIEEILESTGVQPDFIYRNNKHITLKYRHRLLDHGHIYWVSNPSDKELYTEVSFRVSGLKPEIWHPETGLSEDVSYEMKDGRTIVKFSMVQNDAVFVVFIKPTKRIKQDIPLPHKKELTTIDSNWTLKFQPKIGNSESLLMDSLVSFTDYSSPSIRYFSGTATYTNSFIIKPENYKKSDKLLLDMGSVKNIAEVYVNGKICGTFWKAPFIVDITAAINPGENTLEIKVTNLWRNGLIGDQQKGVTPQYYTSYHFFKSDSALLPSGLLGPIRLIKY